MKVYKGRFKKQNGQIREMLFAHLSDLPENYLEAKIAGSGVVRNYPSSMELVWDVEADNFRIFNYATQIGDIEEASLEL